MRTILSVPALLIPLMSVAATTSDEDVAAGESMYREAIGAPGGNPFAPELPEVTEPSVQVAPPWWQPWWQAPAANEMVLTKVDCHASNYGTSQIEEGGVSSADFASWQETSGYVPDTSGDPFAPHPDNMPMVSCTMSCPAGELMMIEFCQARTEHRNLNDAMRGVSANLRREGVDTARCGVWGQYEHYMYVPAGLGDFDDDRFDEDALYKRALVVDASAYCVSLP